MIQASGERGVVGKELELALMMPLRMAMMLLVVLYHSCVMWVGEGWFDDPAVPCAPLGELALWLNTFHVPTFVFASGYVYSYTRRETGHYGSVASVLVRKARRLLLPYVFVSALWAAPIYVAFFGPRELFHKFVLAASPSQLWFLPMLFWCFAALEFVRLFIPGLARRPMALFLASAAASLGALVVSGLVGDTLQLSSTLQYLPLFCAGYAFRVWNTGRFWSLGPLPLLALDLTLYAVWLTVAAADGPVASVVAYVLLLTLRLVGCAMALSLVGRLRKPEGPVVEALARDSFGIYLFHQQIVFVALSALNTPQASPVLAVAACFVVSVAVSLGMTEVLLRGRLSKMIVGKG